MPLTKRTKGIVAAVVVTVIVVGGIVLSTVVFPQLHVGYISDQKASAILNETLTLRAKNYWSIDKASWDGASYVDHVEYNGTFPVTIIIAHYNSTSDASAYYSKVCASNENNSFTFNGTYRGYHFSYGHLFYYKGHLYNSVDAWCLLKNYVVNINNFGIFLSYSTTTVVDFVHAQMDAML